MTDGEKSDPSISKKEVSSTEKDKLLNKALKQQQQQKHLAKEIPVLAQAKLSPSSVELRMSTL